MSTNKTQEQWLKGFQRYVFDTLGNIIKDAERRKKYVTESAMQTWVTAVTHESINPVSNYEDLEARGDFMLKSAFPNYLFNRFKNIDKDTITKTNSKYMSGQFQETLTQKMKLDAWIRSEKITTQVLGDVFEAFVGALFLVVSDVDGKGCGYVCCENLVIWLFNDINIDLTAVGDAKTFVQQTLSRLGLEKKPREVEDIHNESYHLEISETAIKFFADRNIYLPKVIGVGRGKTKKAAIVMAYETAMNRMEKAGITPEWISRERLQYEFSDPSFQPYLVKAQENLKKLGFDQMYFRIPQNVQNRTSSILILIGVKLLTNEHIIIGTVEVPGQDYVEGKRQLLAHLANRTDL